MGCQSLPSLEYRFRTCIVCTSVALFPTRPLHHTAALDSGSEAECVRSQARGLETQAFDPLPSCLLAFRLHAWPRPIV